eukprot:tig00000042_g15406.t1
MIPTAAFFSPYFLRRLRLGRRLGRQSFRQNPSCDGGRMQAAAGGGKHGRDISPFIPKLGAPANERDPRNERRATGQRILPRRIPESSGVLRQLTPGIGFPI